MVGLGPRASNAHAPAAAAGTAADVGSPDAQAAPRFIDCDVREIAPPAHKKLRVTLPDNLGLVPGQPLRLARHRYDAVFPLPGRRDRERRRQGPIDLGRQRRPAPPSGAP